MNRNKIMEYVYTSQVINTAFNRFIRSEDRDEFKHYIISIIADCSEKQFKKFESAYDRGEIDFLIYSIMRNQYTKETSPWNRKHKIRDVVIPYVEIREETDPEVMEMKMKIEKMLPEIKQILDERTYYTIYHTKYDYQYFLRKNYHETLFEMHFIEGKSFKQIEELTGVKYHTIRLSIIQTLDYIKTKMNYDNYTD